MEKQPADFDIHDVTERAQLHAEMNRHASWLISLALRLDLRGYHGNLISGRSFLAQMIDVTAQKRR